MPSPRPTVPPLHPRLADPTLPALVGTGVWFLASAGLFAANMITERPLDELFWTTTAGWVIGLLGYGLFRWQRSAARRGSRSAQRGLDGGPDVSLDGGPGGEPEGGGGGGMGGGPSGEPESGRPAQAAPPPASP